LRLSASDTTYHINRCSKCGRLLTKLEITARIDGRKPLPICPCGSNSFRPSMCKAWEYFLPRVIWLAVGVLRGTVKEGVAT
jgi:NAD-dependent SIR2 family protein deacetylase